VADRWDTDAVFLMLSAIAIALSAVTLVVRSGAERRRAPLVAPSVPA
jgi:hypothetical protein